MYLKMFCIKSNLTPKYKYKGTTHSYNLATQRETLEMKQTHTTDAAHDLWGTWNTVNFFHKPL